MGEWDDTAGSGVYRQTVTDGFILTKGSLNINLGEHHFGDLSLKFPSFQLLKVHEGCPMNIYDGGKIEVRPSGDDRLIGEILRDPDPKVYDAVTFLLAPYEVDLSSDHPGNVLEKMDGFQCEDGNRNFVSLIYVPERNITSVDGDGVRNVSVLIPTQIHNHLFEWVYHAGREQAYDSGAKMRESWKDIGRYDIQAEGLPAVVDKINRTLEKRFDTRLLVNKFG
jgi:hypothetical protein